MTRAASARTALITTGVPATTAAAIIRTSLHVLDSTIWAMAKDARISRPEITGTAQRPCSHIWTLFITSSLPLRVHLAHRATATTLRRRRWPDHDADQSPACTGPQRPPQACGQHHLPALSCATDVAELPMRGCSVT